MGISAYSDENSAQSRITYTVDSQRGQGASPSDVTLGDHPIRRMLLERLKRVLAGPHDAPMPVGLDPEQLGGQVANLVGQRLLADAWAEQATPFDLVEQLRSLALSIQKPLGASIFV